jgi:hypothetical protein
VPSARKDLLGERFEGCEALVGFVDSLALFTREFEDEVQAAFPPRWVQRLRSPRRGAA